VLAYVKQLFNVIRISAPYEVEKLKVFMKNAFKVAIIPYTFVVAVYNGLKAVFGQRNANSANAAKAQQAVNDANDALAQAQQGLLDATKLQKDAEAAVERAKKDLADALNAQAAAANPSAAAAAAGLLDDDFLNDIFQQGLAAQAAQADQDVVEKQAAQDAAEQVAIDTAKQAQVAAQLEQNAADAAQKAATNAPADGKWNAFVKAFSGSFGKLEQMPASPAPPTSTYESPDKVATAAKAKLKSTDDEALKKIVDANADAEQRDKDEATLDNAEAAAAVYNFRFEKSQMWMVTGVPTRNTTFPALINIPVYHFRLRASNLTNFSGEEIENDTKLKVEFQKFSKEEVA
jgi:5-hydroxyisourate hydrolase-like protein (transthyretin family)